MQVLNFGSGDIGDERWLMIVIYNLLPPKHHRVTLLALCDIGAFKLTLILILDTRLLISSPILASFSKYVLTCGASTNKKLTNLMMFGRDLIVQLERCGKNRFDE